MNMRIEIYLAVSKSELISFLSGSSSHLGLKMDESSQIMCGSIGKYFPLKCSSECPILHSDKPCLELHKV